MDPEREFRAAIEPQGLSSFDAEVLSKIARDAHGLEEDAAPWFVASITGRPHEECSKAIIHLLGRNLLVRVPQDGSSSRLFVNFEVLGIDEVTRQALFARLFRSRAWALLIRRKRCRL